MVFDFCFQLLKPSIVACESKYIFIILFAGHVRIAVSREKISARVDDGYCDSAPEKELVIFLFLSNWIQP